VRFWLKDGVLSNCEAKVSGKVSFNGNEREEAKKKLSGFQAEKFDREHQQREYPRLCFSASVDPSVLACHPPHMSTVPVELPEGTEIRSGEEVTIHARAVGGRLVASRVVHATPVISERDTGERRSALGEFLREWSGAAQRHWTDEEIRHARHEHLRAKHLR
jgi:hypothetical protein